MNKGYSYSALGIIYIYICYNIYIYIVISIPKSESTLENQILHFPAAAFMALHGSAALVSNTQFNFIPVQFVGRYSVFDIVGTCQQ